MFRVLIPLDPLCWIGRVSGLMNGNQRPVVRSRLTLTLRKRQDMPARTHRAADSTASFHMRLGGASLKRR
jgi:hypothetical protein